MSKQGPHIALHFDVLRTVNQLNTERGCTTLNPYEMMISL